MCGAEECLTKHTSEPQRVWRLGIILNGNGIKGSEGSAGQGRHGVLSQGVVTLSPLLVLVILGLRYHLRYSDQLVSARISIIVNALLHLYRELLLETPFKDLANRSYDDYRFLL